MSDLIKTYNPANAGALTEDQVKAMQNFTSDELKQLAIAYPNGAMTRAYLLIIDKSKPPEKQLPSLSTFQNLWNLREKNGLKNLVAWRFRENKAAGSVVKPGKQMKAKKTEVLDLSETDLLNLPGFKTGDMDHPGQTVEVTKVKKVKTPKIETQSQESDEDINQRTAQVIKQKKKPGPKPKTQTTI
jgi:hypothetical protein